MQHRFKSIFTLPENPVAKRLAPWLQGQAYAIRHFDARSDVIQDGKPNDELCVVVGGWAARNKIMLDGSRQISALCVPGDMFNLEALLTGRSWYTITALTPMVVACFPMEKVRRIAASNQQAQIALSAAIMRQELILTEWLACLGRRSTRERLAHLLCELQVRLHHAGLSGDGGYMLPLTQQDFGDALGVSTIHINRTLKSLRDDRLVLFRSGRMHIADVAALREVAGFDPNYLCNGAFATPL